jgi:hypothetical protein
MVKRSSSKRAYKKRRTVRKSRVIRRRKTARSKTLRGGKFGDTFKVLAGKGVDFASNVAGSVKDQFASRFDSSDADKIPISKVPSGPSAEDSEAAKAMAEAAAAEENKANLKKIYDDAMGAYDAAKQNRDEAKKNFGKGPNLDNAQAAASAVYEDALNAARAAAAGGVENVIYP